MENKNQQERGQDRVGFLIVGTLQLERSRQLSSGSNGRGPIHQMEEGMERKPMAKSIYLLLATSL